MTKEKEVLQGAASAQTQQCDVCGCGTAEEVPPSKRCPASFIAYADETGCWKLGYERLLAEAAKHEGCIDEMRKDFDLTLDQQLDRAEAAEKRVAELEQALRNIAEAQSWRKLVP